MYCPKCSQQQASEEQRFCSRCGFPLAGVALLLENDGAMPLANQTAGPRGRMMKEGVILTFVTWMVALLATTMFDRGGPFETVAKVGALIFFVLGLIGLLRFVFAFLFVREGVSVPSPPAFPSSTRRDALPSPQENPLTDYPQRTNTKEMQPRDSITEHTTHLLDDK
jgi:hypothetical protein